MKTIFSIISTTLLLINIHATAQNNFKTSTGIGLMELINLGVDYQIKQSEVGVNIGIWPTQINGFSFMSNYYYHFAGKSRFSDLRPWYIRAGINLLRDKSKYSIDYKYITSLRFGRDFNFSNKIGIGIDAGVCYYLYHTVIVLEEDPFPTGRILYFLPSCGIKVFYRF